MQYYAHYEHEGMQNQHIILINLIHQHYSLLVGAELESGRAKSV
jgi:hypothetical protein